MHSITIYDAIDRERERQHRLHGEHTPANTRMSPHEKMTILTEEVGEVAAEIQTKNSENLRTELIQVMAVCKAWLESIEGV